MMDLTNDTTVITASDGGVLLDDSSTRVLTGCFLSLLILSTLLGNILVCAAVTKCRHLRSKVTNFFVISLAVSDLLVAVLVMPWKAVTEVAGFWPFGSFCDTWVAFDIMCSTASILNLCVISVDRYWAISSPFRYERKMTPKVAFVMISVAWTLSVLISFIPVQLNWHKAQTFTSTSITTSTTTPYSLQASPDSSNPVGDNNTHQAPPGLGQLSLQPEPDLRHLHLSDQLLYPSDHHGGHLHPDLPHHPPSDQMHRHPRTGRRERQEPTQQLGWRRWRIQHIRIRELVQDDVQTGDKGPEDADSDRGRVRVLLAALLRPELHGAVL
ncbi:hypothetical protein J4Q44_G00311100 [Coregonus suidteri]|uniref:Dopamine D1 receptor n=1 Tax=Coregonus suidteri TaxID=861788 RepID=A0AAN8QAX0_9TELE